MFQAEVGTVIPCKACAGKGYHYTGVGNDKEDCFECHGDGRHILDPIKPFDVIKTQKTTHNLEFNISNLLPVLRRVGLQFGENANITCKDGVIHLTWAE